MRHKLLDDYYKSPEYMSKLMARFEVLKSCEAEPLRINQLAIERWSVDPIEFIEQFGWISIPEFNNESKPFFLFDYQKRVIAKIWEAELSGEDHEILIDKPRGMGLTWTLVWYEIWRWMFSPRWGGFNLSRTESEVDDGTTDPKSSIFGKFRWSISMMPEFMMPTGFAPKGKKGTITDSMLRISNPQIGSSLVGSTTNSNAGRSRRYSLIFVDECFAIEHFRRVYSSLQSVARVKVFVSTVKSGKVNQDFKDMCELAGNYISLSWKDHPFKDIEWYNEQVKKAEFDPEVMKEIEVDYAVNIRSQYYPEIRTAKCIEDVQYSRARPLYVSMDWGSQDNTWIIWWQFDGSFFIALEAVSSSRKPLDWYVPFLNPSVQYNPEHYTPYHREILEKARTWNKPLAYFGEAAHFQRVMPLNRSVADELGKWGVRLMSNNNAIQHEPRRRATSMLLPRTIFNMSADGVTELYDSIASSRYASSARSTSKDSSMKPVHDEYSDARSAAENFYVNAPRLLRVQRKELDSEMRDQNTIGMLIKKLKV